jgi:putative FmdB family regulatory protein
MTMLYEYVCSDCGQKFEVFIRSPKFAAIPKCPVCGSKDTQNALSIFIPFDDQYESNISTAPKSCAMTRKYT